MPNLSAMQKSTLPIPVTAAPNNPFSQTFPKQNHRAQLEAERQMAFTPQNEIPLDVPESERKWKQDESTIGNPFEPRPTPHSSRIVDASCAQRSYHPEWQARAPCSAPFTRDISAATLPTNARLIANLSNAPGNTTHNISNVVGESVSDASRLPVCDNELAAMVRKLKRERDQMAAEITKMKLASASVGRTNQNLTQQFQEIDKENIATSIDVGDINITRGQPDITVSQSIPSFSQFIPVPKHQLISPAVQEFAVRPSTDINPMTAFQSNEPTPGKYNRLMNSTPGKYAGLMKAALDAASSVTPSKNLHHFKEQHRSQQHVQYQNPLRQIQGQSVTPRMHSDWEDSSIGEGFSVVTGGGIASCSNTPASNSVVPINATFAMTSALPETKSMPRDVIRTQSKSSPSTDARHGFKRGAHRTISLPRERDGSRYRQERIERPLTDWERQQQERWAHEQLLYRKQTPKDKNSTSTPSPNTQKKTNDPGPMQELCSAKLPPLPKFLPMAVPTLSSSQTPSKITPNKLVRTSNPQPVAVTPLTRENLRDHLARKSIRSTESHRWEGSLPLRSRPSHGDGDITQEINLEKKLFANLHSESADEVLHKGPTPLKNGGGGGLVGQEKINFFKDALASCEDFADKNVIVQFLDNLGSIAHPFENIPPILPQSAGAAQISDLRTPGVVSKTSVPKPTELKRIVRRDQSPIEPEAATFLRAVSNLTSSHSTRKTALAPHDSHTSNGNTSRSQAHHNSHFTPGAISTVKRFQNRSPASSGMMLPRCLAADLCTPQTDFGDGADFQDPRKISTPVQIPQLGPVTPLAPATTPSKLPHLPSSGRSGSGIHTPNGTPKSARLTVASGKSSSTNRNRSQMSRPSSRHEQQELLPTVPTRKDHRNLLPSVALSIPTSCFVNSHINDTVHDSMFPNDSVMQMSLFQQSSIKHHDDGGHLHEGQLLNESQLEEEDDLVITMGPDEKERMKNSIISQPINNSRSATPPPSISVVRPSGEKAKTEGAQCEDVNFFDGHAKDGHGSMAHRSTTPRSITASRITPSRERDVHISERSEALWSLSESPEEKTHPYSPSIGASHRRDQQHPFTDSEFRPADSGFRAMDSGRSNRSERQKRLDDVRDVPSVSSVREIVEDRDRYSPSVGLDILENLRLTNVGASLTSVGSGYGAEGIDWAGLGGSSIPDDSFIPRQKRSASYLPRQNKHNSKYHMSQQSSIAAVVKQVEGLLGKSTGPVRGSMPHGASAEVGEESISCFVHC